MENRRASTRINRGEPPFKRLRQTPSPTPHQQKRKPGRPPGRPKTVKAAKPATAVEPEAEPIPSKLSDSKALPIMPKTAEPLDGPLQSVAQSGVLAAALKRSRSKWAVEGLFEKYWSKPTKRKGHEEPKDNPPKESMRPLGGCRVVVEPHRFQATLHHVLDLPPLDVPKPVLANASPTPGASTGVQAPAIPAVTGQTPGRLQQLPQRPTALPLPSPQQQNKITAATPTKAPSPKAVPLPPAPAAAKQKTNVTPGKASPATATSTAQPPPITGPRPGQDPVIQMLAQRATTNPELKELMKVVASGSASEPQLRVFQSHINELNGIVQRQAADGSKAPAQLAGAKGISQPASGHFKNGAPGNAHVFQPHRVVQPVGNIYHQSFTAPYAPHTMAKPRPMKATIGVAIEFAEGSGDRFLFPKHCILELNPKNSHITASFLIVKKGDSRYSGMYRSSAEVYQPITIRLEPDGTSKIYETLVKIVAPYAESRRYMEDVMSRMERAHDVQLVLQLPSASASHGDADKRTHGAWDRLQSLQASSRASPASFMSDSKPGRGSKQKESWDQLCEYCYEALPQESAQLARACDSCSQLVVAQVRKSLALAAQRRPSPRRVPEASGPQALVY